MCFIATQTGADVRFQQDLVPWEFRCNLLQRFDHIYWDAQGDRSVNIQKCLFGGGSTRRNDTNQQIVRLNVNHIEHSHTHRIEPNNGTPRLTHSRSVNQPQHRIAEDGDRFLEANTVLVQVLLGLLFVPDKQVAVQFVRPTGAAQRRDLVQVGARLRRRPTGLSVSIRR